MKRFPNVPTLKEAGYGIVSTSSFGIGGPKSLDPKVVKILHEAFKKGLNDPTFLKVLDKLDMPNLYLNTEDYNKYNRQVYEEEGVMIEKLGLSKKK
jgi:tripartite-type tricarboxylate transporter receptor subunit TctC